MREAGMQEGSQVSGSELSRKIPFTEAEAGGKVLSISARSGPEVSMGKRCRGQWAGGCWGWSSRQLPERKA